VILEIFNRQKSFFKKEKKKEKVKIVKFL